MFRGITSVFAWAFTHICVCAHPAQWVWFCKTSLAHEMWLVDCSWMFSHATGRAGWGIAWYINGTLIPELIVERNKTYTFIVEGGTDSDALSNYHPLYITDSIGGGRLQNTQQERDVSPKKHCYCVHISISITVLLLFFTILEWDCLCWIWRRRAWSGKYEHLSACTIYQHY